MALADTGAIAACRAAHGDNPAAHIECLERALKARDREAPDTESPKRKLGAEQIRKRSQKDSVREHATVQIVAVSYSEQGRGLFEMADGQVWGETERSPRNDRLIPGQQYSARIQRGVLGGYRMYVDGMRRMIKIERLK